MGAVSTRSLVRAVVVVAGLMALPACSGRDGPADEVRESALSPASVTITLSTPKDVATTSVALAANGSLIVNAATTVTGGGAGSTTANSIVTNVGTAGSRFEPDVQLKGDVWSPPTLTLKDRVHVFGVTHATAAPVRGTGVLTDGGVDTTTPLTPATTLTWTVALPASGPAINVSPGASTSRGPGAYGSVTVFQNATLTLSTGTYYFDTLQLESGAHVVLNQTSGPVVIYVRTTLILRGDIKAATSGAAPDLLLVYLGTVSASAEVPFAGTLIAPNARLFLGSVTPGHTGAFFAKNLEVGAHTKVTFRAPHVLLVAGRVPGKSCLDAIVPDPTLTGNAREVQYQADVLRYCTGVEMGPCERAVVARMNVDFFTSAARLVGEVVSPAAYLAVVQDRHRKLKTIRGNEALSCAITQGDGDGDFVPNGQDVCPTTPDLTPTLANGCTNTTLPPAPTVEEMRPALAGGIAVAVDPRCVRAPTPMVPAPLGAWRYPPDPTQGKAIWVSRDGGTSGCPIWYEVEVELTDGLGIRHLTFNPSEDTTVPWIARPAGAVQFHLTTSDPTNRGAWASYSVYTKQYRTRAVNGGGRRSSWSDWFSPGHEDCLAGLCPDGRTP
jgi:hypothetical protein